MSIGDSSIDDNFVFGEDMDMSIVSNLDNSSKEGKARGIIEENLGTCGIADLEERVLRPVCPILKENLIEVIDEIESKLGRSKSARVFDDLFIKCQSALEPWNELMTHVELLGKSLNPASLKSLIDNFPNAVIRVSGHCKSNRHVYPKEQLPPLLSDVFRKACGLVKVFCNLLTSRISFSPQDDQAVLKRIISDVGEIARLTTYDLVTMGHAWKTFTKLTIMHKDILIREDCIDNVRSHFKHLTMIINSLYNNIIKSSVGVFEKRAKCTVFLLSILERLQSVFCKDHPLKDDFIRKMMENLINLSANHVMCTGARLEDQKDLYKARAKIITSNHVESIINCYADSDIFWRIFLEEFEEVKKRKDLKYAMGYHSIVLLTSQKWKPEDLFFQIAIENINNLQEEVLVRSLDFPVLDDEDKSVYEMTLSALMNFLIRRIDDFTVYERMLLKNLMSESLWPSLMAHDVLQGIYRISSEELLVIHIRQFMGAYEVLEERGDSLSGVILGRLILDIYERLSTEGRETALRNCTSPRSLRVILKSGSSDDSIRARQMALYRKITAVEPVNSLPEVIADLRRQPTVKNWNRMVEILKLMGIVKEITNRTNTEKLCEVSSLVMNAVEDATGCRKIMLLDVILLLFDCAEINAGDQSFNWSLISVLFSRVTHNSDLPLDFLIKICHYLTKNAHRLNSTSKENMPVLSNVFCYLLNHRNDFVRQEALEAYDHIVETCGNDDLVGNITRVIAQHPELRDMVSAYLKKQLLVEIPWIEYLRSLSRNTLQFSTLHPHQCREEEEEIEHEEKRFKSGRQDLDTKGENIYEQLKLLCNEKK
uniref:UppS_0 protein n=1 Tax=Fopius arisanus TaxID=64838 RepID=A0A0C9RCL3_9HYME